MKKKLIIIGIIILIIIVFGLFTSYMDSARVRNSREPKFTIKVVSKDGSKITYWGLGYKVIRYVSVSPNEPYKNNRGVKYGSWFMKYEISDIPEDKIIEVIKLENSNDKTYSKYLERDGITIYVSDNIKEIYYLNSDKKITLKDHIENLYQTTDDSIKELTKHLSFIDAMNDGGTSFYKSKEYDMTLVKCNTLQGNNDVYIGDYMMEFDYYSTCGTH